MDQGEVKHTGVYNYEKGRACKTSGQEQYEKHYKPQQQQQQQGDVGN